MGQYCIISLRGEMWVNKTSLTPPLFIEVTLPSHACEWSCICVLGVSSLPIYKILLLNFVTIPRVWYFFFILISLYM